MIHTTKAQILRIKALNVLNDQRSCKSI